MVVRAAALDVGVLAMIKKERAERAKRWRHKRIQNAMELQISKNGHWVRGGITKWGRHVTCRPRKLRRNEDPRSDDEEVEENDMIFAILFKRHLFAA